jgi:hypothetical protein
MAAMRRGETETRDRTFSCQSRLYLAFALLTALVVGTLATSSAASNPSALQTAILVQEQRSNGLLTRPAVVGTGVSKDESGEAEIVVFTERSVRLPGTLNGVPVDVEVTGPITSMEPAPRKGQQVDSAGKNSGPSPTGRFVRPVPIGVSTGNAGECSAGTIGARVKDPSGNVYALSNNHVYALENSAPIGSEVLQPGLYDTGCSYSAANVLGTLTDFEPIAFSSSASNIVDAAIASTTTSNLGNATPANGYGTPSSAAQSATVGLPVQKYGRTTSLTSGTVTAVNAIINVGYGAGTARFVDQVVVQSNKPFIKAGDSGSLLVTKNAGVSPVGLLFAGGSSGKFAVANPIGAVLTRFGVTIDGK